MSFLSCFLFFCFVSFCCCCCCCCFFCKFSVSFVTGFMKTGNNLGKNRWIIWEILERIIGQFWSIIGSGLLSMPCATANPCRGHSWLKQQSARAQLSRHALTTKDILDAHHTYIWSEVVSFPDHYSPCFCPNVFAGHSCQTTSNATVFRGQTFQKAVIGSGQYGYAFDDQTLFHRPVQNQALTQYNWEIAH